MRDITIRQYDPSDLEPCRALWAELILHHRHIYDDPSIGGNSLGCHFDKHLARVGPDQLWLAEHGGRVVGLVGLIVEGQEAEVEPIVVASAQRKTGVGQALLARMVEEAGKLGVRYLSVKPVARNLEAISFYYEFGFQTLGEIEMFMDLGSPDRDTWRPGPVLFGHAFKY
jgi:N-acetylglutamate synthase-like GNAT family acetyltransferase